FMYLTISKEHTLHSVDIKHASNEQELSLEYLDHRLLFQYFNDGDDYGSVVSLCYIDKNKNKDKDTPEIKSDSCIEALSNLYALETEDILIRKATFTDEERNTTKKHSNLLCRIKDFLFQIYINYEDKFIQIWDRDSITGDLTFFENY
ncbi:MAG: hypothetical protein ACOC56_06390, partial [Atribacterota bacterium]